MPDSISAVGNGGRYTYDENGAGLCEAQSLDSLAAEENKADQDVDCALKAAKAGLVCAGAVVAVIGSAPTLIGGVATAFITGAACGVEVADAYICYEDD